MLHLPTTFKKRPTHQSATNIATSVPPEIWLRIFELLSFQELKNLTLVHRVFAEYARPRIWRKLSLCTLDQQCHGKAQLIIRQPELALYVEHLHLRPGYNTERAPTDLWTCDPSIRTWVDVAKAAKWKQLTKPWRHFLRSRQSIAAAVRIAPLLTNLSKLIITASFSDDYQPNPDPYHKLWIGLKESRLRCLEIHFYSHSSLKTFSSILRTSSIVLNQFEAFFLTIWGLSCSDKEIQKDVQALADVGRGSLRSLGVTINTYQPIQTALMNGLGFFPNLVHFNGSFHNDHPHECVTEFLLRHRSTLVCLSLEGYIHHLLPVVIFKSMPDFSGPLKLTSIRLIDRHRGMEPFWSIVQPRMTAYADTLTTLAITTGRHNRQLQHGFDYKEVEEVILSLYKPSQGVLLRKLRLPLEYLSPDIINLMQVISTILQLWT
ncbi:hypothetical protein BDN72DRAFT_963715 [Pluteus cervinus]|uniref:Uncharacterized protein n=1 Tax=Pluteus cervinus TaxID=181527 RepID=A0ACD3ADK3_9AGAR|nr:hypothetical protein BDN72DRAFT_963715 [Pluteus cervinus]